MTKAITQSQMDQLMELTLNTDGATLPEIAGALGLPGVREADAALSQAESLGVGRVQLDLDNLFHPRYRFDV